MATAILITINVTLSNKQVASTHNACMQDQQSKSSEAMNAQNPPCGFNEVLLVSVTDADLFCRPGNEVVAVNADPAAFFFTDAADVYTGTTTASAMCNRFVAVTF